MDERLAKIARLGDVVALNALLKEDPFILEKVDLAPVAETPLHIAVLAGKTDFVKEMLKRMPAFAQEINEDGFTPIHMASARGHIDIVRELLMFGKDHLCLLKDKGARTPLHCAAIKGRVEIIKELLDNSCHQAVHEVTTRGETVLHLAVKNNQFEALSVFVDWLKRNGGLEELLNAEDKGGNTISELAKATKQLQVIDLLSELQKEETLEIVSTDAGDSGIDTVTDAGDSGIDTDTVTDAGDTGIDTDTVTDAGATGIDTVTQEGMCVPTSRVLQNDQTVQIVSMDAGGSIVTQAEIRMPTQEQDEQAENKSEQKHKNKRNYENLILVVASLIATVTFQALVTPPQSIWKDGLEGDRDICTSNPVTSLEDFINFMKTCRVISYIIFIDLQHHWFFLRYLLPRTVINKPGFGETTTDSFPRLHVFCVHHLINHHGSK
ncbi:hypothetical protein F0562_002095 [Nyssa sinensis]|uniref:PGG domain-containing protein n=1 Tax=Nyssa sinensis TaxID=561372 RepID=A0A5J5C9Y8_9ASTE|nr:hypothetical protein F0562_002095 [Nyssa sinensis]